MRRRQRLAWGAAACACALGALTVSGPASAAPAVATIATSPSTVAAPSAVAAPARRTPEARAFIRSIRRLVVDTALSRVGSSYVWGGSGPDEFDCSGLVMWTYLTVTKLALPHYSGAQMDMARPVTGKLRKGDLLFYGPDGSQHVSIYIGNDQMVGANNPTTGIVIDDITSSYWASRYVGAGRLVG